MTTEQIKWAAEHDWFVFGTWRAITVQEIIWCPETKTETIKIIHFHNFKKLREWAGY